MADPTREPSARETQLLDLAYRYALEHGTVELPLRALASAIGSSPRVLLFLFGSKDGLLRALLGRARAEELRLLAEADLASASSRVRALWSWLAAPEHRSLLTLWLDAYSRSLTAPDGPWSGFAQATVDDWLALLGPDRSRATSQLAVLRGALLDLLATGDVERTTEAVTRLLDSGCA
ncbi:MAG TPA: TetR/AcrR family transcriptional regulator [Pseudonocardiaceae bacterium]|nr:TetR/AcrR family transcriptional regulator [Pseudonocardiaceae bacterium]